MEKNVNLSKLITQRVGGAQAASKERQFRPWLENSNIKDAHVYRNFARTGLAEWQGRRIYLALDTSSLWDRFVIVRVALFYRGRALPLRWLVRECGYRRQRVL